MKHYLTQGAIAVVAVYVAFMLPGVGDMLRKEAQKPVGA